MENFTTAARSYCSLLETEEFVHPRVFVLRCLETLLHLYSHALQLPDTAPATSEITAIVSQDDVKRVLQNLSVKLDRDCYWTVFEPFEPEPCEPVVGLLSDDLADIWLNVREGLLIMEKGEWSNAVWQWRFSFETHWGRHAVSAMTALHALIFGSYSLAAS